MDNCRLCGMVLKKPFLSLGNSPLANSYLTKTQLGMMEPFYPLDVYICEHCFLVQIDECETAQNIFTSEYAYFSSYSDSWLQHSKLYVDMMIKRFGFNKESFVVEIASNDGYLLQYFKEHDVPTLGVEPARNAAEVAIEKGIQTDVSFFNTLYASEMREKSRLADLIIGNNVLAHNPNINDFVKGLGIALKPSGIITMEIPHLLRLIEHNQFDTIYHEHYSYFSFHAVKKLFELHNLEIFDVEELSTHGGSLRVYVKNNHDQSKRISPGVNEILQSEKNFGLLDMNTYHEFDERIKSTKRNLLSFLIEAKKSGKRIVGYGAPAKGNTLLNYCGIRADFLDYTVDRSLQKQNKFLPGTHIPIKHPDRIKEDKPDYVLILPWNIKEEIMGQLSFISEWGGRFVIPIPKVLVI
ncbi:MAG: class I SAM-dependent methyltransferase [Atribacterota bacterium]|nr:class I SAM-dependent methyltransferase [Atribacterota bacterium]